MRTAPPVVFLGPTMATEDAARILPARYLPPAARGAIVEAVQRFRPFSILLVDGVFGTEPAVRHAEILWAMSRGVRVVGAASMGALRAAELQSQGMIGIGLIYRWYRRFALAPDDAVAVLHAPPELGSFPLTRALVDIRATLRRAERRGLLDRATRIRLEGAAASLNFRDRSLTAVVATAFADMHLDARVRFCAMLDEDWISQKRLDATAALRRLEDAEALNDWVVPSKSFVLTTSFLRDMAEAGLDPS